MISIVDALKEQCLTIFSDSTAPDRKSSVEASFFLGLHDKKHG